MPTYAQILALAVALAALIGFGTVTTQSMRHLELKQQRILDGDIDRILAQRREARRDDTIKPQVPGPSQIQPSAQAGARESDGPRTGIAAVSDRPPPRNVEPLRETDARELDPRDPEARQSMAQARKSARRAARASRREALMTPRDLGRLPMFTVKTLLGFR